MSEGTGPTPGLLSIGEEAKPPFAVLPDLAHLFLNRSKRFAALAAGHELGPYLGLLAAVTHAQHDIQAHLPQPALPPYQVNDPALDPMADDVATVGLDMLLAEEGWKRGGHNPFLLGY